MPSLGDFTAFDNAAEQAGQVEPDTFTFHGETFTVAEQVSSIPMMRLAKLASGGLNSSEVEGLLALHDFLEQTLVEGDFTRFCDVALRHKVSDDTILAIAQKVYTVIAGRPTKRLPSSTPGQPPTSRNSKPLSLAMVNAGLTAEDMVTPEEGLQLLQGAG